MRLASCALVLLLTAGSAAALDVRPLADGLEAPVDLAFGSDGRLYYAELRSGHLRALSASGEVSAPLVTVPASPGGNGGFIGLAADPDDARVVYAYYSMDKADAPTGKINRVVRLDLDTGTETVLLDDLPWTEFHDGGRLAVGPDGHLYVTTGDNGRPDLKPGDHGDDYPSQDPADVRGKILRIDRTTGEAAPDNPGGEENPLVYARGFRNPFGIDITPDGRVFVSDNGEAQHDEVNLVAPGGNHGWPYCAGPCDRADTVDPIASWETAFGPTGIAVRGSTVYVGDFNNELVRTVDVDTGETGTFWKSGGGPVLDVELGPDGCLYASTFGAIWLLQDEGAECGLEDAPQGGQAPPADGDAAPPPQDEGVPPATDSDAPPADTGGPAESVDGGTDPAAIPGLPLALAAAGLLLAARLRRAR